MKELSEGTPAPPAAIYDFPVRRIRKTVGTKTTWYLYSPQGLVAELNDSGKVKKADGWEPTKPGAARRYGKPRPATGN